MARLPEGTITFMLTDLQGSTHAWDSQPKAMRSAMARHDAILAGAVRDHSGELVEAGREGDSVLAVFRTAATAAACALDIQKDFDTESWPDGLDLKVRIALHTGEAQLREGHYFGPALNRCARLLAICNPGQILLTKATETMLADEVPTGSVLRDLGLHRLKDLARPEQVFQLGDPGRAIEFPTIRSQPQTHAAFPRYLTSFVERGGELTALKSMLARSRMVTLTGPGGAGKSRLAAELARICLDSWSGAVWWVDLASVDDPRQVPGAVVAALELSGRGPAQDVVTAWLAATRALLVLDSCEHLVSACAELCQVALQRCSELTVLATSREPLGVPGEAHWTVSSLRSSDAVQLFEARARLVLPDFTVVAENREPVTEICQQLDGIPLAIELAAARVGMLTEHEILSQLTDRFHLLIGGHRTAPERQQTLVATIDWSYRLLTEDEALLFRRLSVFRGGFTLESAQSVCSGGMAGRVLDLLAGLVQKSMVIADRTEGSGSRYRLFESQLAYAEDRLREGQEIELMRRRHYEYFRDSLGAKTASRWAGRAMSSPTPGVAIADWKAQESSNLWAAMGWARNNADDLGLSLAVDFEIRDFTQARNLMADLLEHSSAQGVLRVKAFARAAFLAWAQGDYEAARQAAESSVALARDVGDVERLASALNQLGMAHIGRGELAAAAEIYEEATSLLKGSTNRSLVAVVENSVAVLAIHTGDYAGASDILGEAVATARALGNFWQLSGFLDTLACAQLGLNDHQAAAANWKEALSICRHLTDNHDIVFCFEGLSCVAGAGGDDHRSLTLAAAAKRMSGVWSLVFDPWLFHYAEESQRRSRLRLGARKSEEAWNEGWAMSLDHAIDYALGKGAPKPRSNRKTRP